MRTHYTAEPSDNLIRTLAGVSLTASAVAGAALAMALAVPAPARAGTLVATPGDAAARAFTLPVAPAPRFGPASVAADEGAYVLARLAASAPAMAPRAAVPQFRLDADEGAVTSTFHTTAYLDMAPAELSRLLLDTVTAARAEYAEQVAEAMAPVREGSVLPYEDIMAGKFDISEFLRGGPSS